MKNPYDMYGGGQFDSSFNDPGGPSHVLDTLACYRDTFACFIGTLYCLLGTLSGFSDTPPPTCPSEPVQGYLTCKKTHHPRTLP